jgi:hypothetical protein
MPNKLQYTWSEDYWECVRPAQLPALTEVRAPSLLEQHPWYVPHRDRAGYNNRTTFEVLRIVACEYSRVFMTSCGSVCSYVWGPCCVCLQGSSTPVKVIIAIFLQYPTFALQVVSIVWIMQEGKSEYFDVFLTVHHSTDLFQITNLMNNSFII